MHFAAAEMVDDFVFLLCRYPISLIYPLALSYLYIP